MTDGMVLTPLLIESMAEKISVEGDGGVDKFGAALGFESGVIQSAIDSGDLRPNPQAVLTLWTKDHGSDEAAAKKLLQLLQENKFVDGAAALESATEKKPDSQKSGDQQQPQQPSDTDRLITLVTAIIVTILGIWYFSVNG